MSLLLSVRRLATVASTRCVLLPATASHSLPQSIPSPSVPPSAYLSNAAEAIAPDDDDSLNVLSMMILSEATSARRVEKPVMHGGVELKKIFNTNSGAEVWSIAPQQTRGRVPTTPSWSH